MAKRFYGTMMHRAGQDPARIVQCRVMNVNLVNWTVDVISQFDRHYYRDIQIAAPYLHYSQGEGIYAVPDVGAVCLVTLPSDTSPPFVSGYVSPMQSVGDTAKPLGNPNESIITTIFGQEEVDPQSVTDTAQTRSRGGTVPHPEVDARFDAGRSPAKTGDIYMKGRDGNFVILHRGGVLQIGSTELAQRIFIPLANKVLDISGNYEHMNTGGGIQWGLQEGPSVTNPPTQRMDTFRIYANDQYCDIRVARGKVYAPVGEPDLPAGSSDDLQNLHIGTDAEIVYEVALAPGGFKSGSGDLANPSIRNLTKLRFFFDRNGGVFLRGEGAALFQFKEEVKVKAKNVTFEVEDNVYLTTKKTLNIDGGKMAELRGEIVRIGAGTNPVARLGDTVQIIIPTAQVTGTLSGQPFTGVITLVTPLYGNIVSGNPNVLA